MRIHCPHNDDQKALCIGRDGKGGLNQIGSCEGCGLRPHFLINELRLRYEAVGGQKETHIDGTWSEQADRFKVMVREYVHLPKLDHSVTLAWDDDSER